ncbi:MAG: hypothetical protein AAGG80_06080 [Pseudomonadota bacterium]
MTFQSNPTYHSLCALLPEIMQRRVWSFLNTIHPHDRCYPTPLPYAMPLLHVVENALRPAWFDDIENLFPPQPITVELNETVLIQRARYVCLAKVVYSPPLTQLIEKICYRYNLLPYEHPPLMYFGFFKPAAAPIYQEKLADFLSPQPFEITGFARLDESQTIHRCHLYTIETPEDIAWVRQNISNLNQILGQGHAMIREGMTQIKKTRAQQNALQHLMQSFITKKQGKKIDETT